MCLILLIFSALEIQKILLSQDASNAALLELADTLCNIGGLCLEWVRQNGPNPHHMADAERSFGEALQIRAGTLGQRHALTAQARALREMAKSNHLPPPPQQRSSTPRAQTPSSAGTSQQAPRSPSGRSAATTKHANVRQQKPSYPQYSTPILPTNNTPDTPVQRPESNNPGGDTPRSTMTADLSPWSRATKDAFDPFKEGNNSDEEQVRPQQQQKEFGASKFEEMPESSRLQPPPIARMTMKAEMSKDEELDLVETEESCLLLTDSSEESTKLISFAETAAERADSALKQKDRSTLLNSTKALLEGGDGAMPSTVTTNAKLVPRELGLAPLR